MYPVLCSTTQDQPRTSELSVKTNPWCVGYFCPYRPATIRQVGVCLTAEMAEKNPPTKGKGKLKCDNVISENICKSFFLSSV